MGRTEAGEVAGGLVEVEVLVQGKLGAGETEGVDEAGVDKTVGNNEVRWASEGGNGAEVGLVAGWKDEGGGKVEEGG
jgi:hypothetical protein